MPLRPLPLQLRQSISTLHAQQWPSFNLAALLMQRYCGILSLLRNTCRNFWACRCTHDQILDGRAPTSAHAAAMLPSVKLSAKSSRRRTASTTSDQARSGAVMAAWLESTRNAACAARMASRESARSSTCTGKRMATTGLHRLAMHSAEGVQIMVDDSGHASGAHEMGSKLPRYVQTDGSLLSSGFQEHQGSSRHLIEAACSAVQQAVHDEGAQVAHKVAHLPGQRLHCFATRPPALGAALHMLLQGSLRPPHLHGIECATLQSPASVHLPLSLHVRPTLSPCSASGWMQESLQQGPLFGKEQ